MGNSAFGDSNVATCDGLSLHKFYSTSAWVDDKAERQLEGVSTLQGVKKIAAFPDLHPGKYGPVGCAILADRIYPELIGNDIGCGMALFALDLSAHRFSLDKGERQLRKLAEISGEENGFGTIGGGNHFCEILRLDEKFDDMNLEKDRLYLLVHSGSRSFGNAIFEKTLPAIRNGQFRSQIDEKGYAKAHDEAIVWAKSNRQAIAENVATLLRTQATLITDNAHNEVEMTDHGWLHRKGAAHAADLVPVAGSRDAHSYLVKSLNHKDALRSMAHGAGRRFNRSQMRARIKHTSSLKAQDRNQFGGHLICDDRELRAEEAGEAYKSITKVIEDLADFKIAAPLARFTPLLTFKNAQTKGGDHGK